jgi:hypothetical protein
VSDFEPELGQALFSNSPSGEIELEEHVEAGINLLAKLVAGGDWYSDSTVNVGPEADFDNGTFQMRAYCWCDGERPGHEDGCPPNFRHGDFEARWYKHLHRGASQNRPMPAERWRRILIACLGSISSAGDDDGR